VPNAGLEAAFDQAVARGAKAATIFANCHLDHDTEPRLPQRIAQKARAAGIAICGANCMGFYNIGQGLRVASFPSDPGIRRGGIVWLAQSGSAFSAFAHNDRRLGFELLVSTGMELVTGVPDYMDWALSREETRVIGLFLETVRDPAGFVAALERAAGKGVPVVALKVGRTARSAAMAATHTGALAGNDAVYQALLRKHGVIQVDDHDEMAATLQLLSVPRRKPGAGALATMHDSGGEREMLVDTAERLGVPLAEIGGATKARIAGVLEPGLHAENPLDGYGTNRDLVPRYAEMLKALTADPAVAAAMFCTNPRDVYWYTDCVVQAIEAAAATSEKPIALASNYALAGERETALRLARAGVPLIRGTRNALLAMRHAFGWREARSRPAEALPDAPSDVRAAWSARLARGEPLAEHEGLALLRDYCIPVPGLVQARTRRDVLSDARGLRFPVALKTDEGHAHKSDVGGVVVGIPDLAALEAAYDAMAAKLGPRVIVMEMAPAGVEIGLGAIRDPAFGTVVMVSAGGVLIEVLDDKAVALAPFGLEEARRLICSLKVSKLLAGVRGRPPADSDALATALARFSVMAADLGELISEIDVNPIIAGPAGAVAVDALVVPQQKG
jgi:acyl-CoA synthetase (NDP forming)